MARGDGKARKGLTKGASSTKPRYTRGGVQKLAFGGKPGESAMARAEASRGVSSSGGLGASTRDGGFGGAGSPAGGGGNNDRIGAGSKISGVTSRSERTSAITSPAAMNARLGPNAAQAMAGAGVSPDTAIRAAMSINRSMAEAPSIIGDKSPGQRMATFNADGSITYSEVPTSTKAKQFYDRILPEEELPVRQTLPTRPISYTPAPRVPSAPPGFRSGYLDQQSVVPGSVSFTQQSRMTPFAETSLGQSLLARSQKPLTKAEAEALAGKLPAGSTLVGSGIASIAYPAPKNFNQAQYNSYPTTIDGYNFNVNVPKSAAVNTPFGPKVGQYNPAPQVASPLANYTGQEQRFRSAPTITGQEQRFPPSGPPKQIYDRITPGGTKQFYDRILPEPETPATPATRPAPPSVVAGRNFTARAFPYQERGGGEDRPLRRRKKPIIEETETMKSGGRVSGTDGVVSRGKTRGRYI